MFTTSISQNLVNFIKDMQQDAPNPVDLELCLDFVESQGVDLTPAVIEQVEDILTFTLA